MSQPVVAGRRAPSIGSASAGQSDRRKAPTRNVRPRITSEAPKRRWSGRLAEVGSALLCAVLFTLWSRSIDVDPLSRVGQVSGLASLQFRFAIVCTIIVAALIVLDRRGSASTRELAQRIACASVAGLASGLVGGGIVVALNGTPWALYVNLGDADALTGWSEAVAAGQSIPAHYPPLVVQLLATLQSTLNAPSGFALQHLQVFGTALIGPTAYLCWRFTLRPLWALGIGVLPVLPLVDPYKPYPLLVLVAFVPLWVRFLQVLRSSESLTIRRATASGVGFGVLLALLFLTYSGWFVWSAAGAVVALIVVTPWRTGVRQAAALVSATVLTFGVVTWNHISGLLGLADSNPDSYHYFDTETEPTYIAMWRDDMPGDAVFDTWPPPGEFAGVGVFTILLITSLAAAIAIGWRRTVLIAIGLPILSAWLMRHLFASWMYETGFVRLYPRTSILILYGLLLLAGFAVYWSVRWLIGRVNRLRKDQRFRSAMGPPPDSSSSLRRPRPIAALALIPIMLIIASAGSALADRYMPLNSEDDRGKLAWVAHSTRLPDGTCTSYFQIHCDR